MHPARNPIFRLALILLPWLGPGAKDAAALPVTWLDASRLNITQASLANADGSFAYTLDLINGGSDAIWFAGFYTEGYQAYDFTSTLAPWQENAYTQFVEAGEDWSLPGAQPEWMLSLFDASGPAQASLGAGASAQIGFSLAGALTGPIRYGYFVQDDYAWNRYSAAGVNAVPEPNSAALAAMGLLILALAFRSRRKRGAKGPRSLLILAGAGLGAVWLPSPASAAADIAISQVYGGGGNSGAQYTHDFIELHNRGKLPVNLAGWSIQYAAAAGTAWQRTLLSGIIPAGGYFLIQEDQGAGGTQALPAPDAAGTLSLSASAGKVALSASAAALTGACPSGLVDQIGYGPSATCFEGTAPAGGLSNTTAAQRAGSGCADTDDNRADFSNAAPAPRNAAAPALVCGADAAPRVTAISPAAGSDGAGPRTSITLTFSEPVSLSGPVSITGSLTGPHSAAISGGPVAFTVDPEADFLTGETVTVAVPAAQVSDLDTLDPPDHPLADFTAAFSIAPPVRISEIQGAGHLSPFAGRNVAGVQGVVTALLGNGFFLQDPDPDTDPSTSEGIFVFTDAAPAVHVGDALVVDGKVSEYRGGGSENLTNTELGSPSISVVSTGNPLPAPVLLGLGGRMPPKETIENDALGNAETSGVFDPDSDGLDFYESLEGMRVQVSDPVVVGPRNGFGEFFVLGDAGTGASVRTGRGGIKVRPDDFNPERIMVDQAGAATHSLDVGDAFSGPIVGVLDYQFGNYRIHPAGLPARISGGLQPEIAEAACENSLTVATFNVENLDPSDPAEKFARLASIIVANLRAPTLIALEEVQDDNGAVNDSTVDAAATAAKLIAAIQAAGGPTYAFKDIAPQDLKDGGEPGGNIRVGFLYRTGKGLTLVGRPGGTAVNAVKAVKTPTGVRLNYSPGRIDPLNPAFANSRKPLVGEFSFQGRAFFVIANHFNSKGGDQPLFGRYQPPARNSETQRKLQAQAVHDFVQSILSLDPCARIIVLGDFNDFEFSQAVQTLKGGILTDLIETLPEAERYSYVYEGNSQSLDHILVSPALAADPGTVYDVVHVNAEFADQASDHDPQRACFEKGPPTCPIHFP